MRVLVACEFSGVVRDAFAALGHDAWSCDLRPCERNGKHLRGDIRYAVDVENNGFYFPQLGRHVRWDIMIGHPPCRTLTNSANRWLYERCSTGTPEERRIEREKAVEFFLFMKNCNIPRIALENPRPHPDVLKKIGMFQQKIQPWLFGDPFTKGVCLWLKNLPPLMATIIETQRKPACWLEGPGEEREKNRSRTYPGIASAMAKQWGALT